MSKQPRRETWGPAEVIIDQAWDLWCADQEDIARHLSGPSLPRRAADALRQAGMLSEQPKRKKKGK